MANLPVPSPRTFGVTEIEVASYFNSLRDALLFLLNPPMASVFQNTIQSIPSATWTDLTMDSTVVDSYGAHSNVTNNARITAVVSGWYWPAGGSSLVANATGARGAKFAKNGTSVQGTAGLFGNAGSAIPSAPAAISLPVFLNAGDYVTIQTYQTSGGALNTQLGGDDNPAFALFWMHA